MKLAVDTAEDLERCAAIVEAMEQPHWEYGLDDIVELYPRATAAACSGGDA